MTAQASMTRFSAAQLPPADREPMVREEIWRQLYGMDITPANASLEFEFNLLTLPGLYYQHSYMSQARLNRNRALAARRPDSVALVCYQDGDTLISCAGQDVRVAAGDAFLVRATETATFQVPSSRFICLDIERQPLLALTGLKDLPPLTVIPRQNNALTLLLRYAKDSMADAALLDTPALQQLALRHIQELLAISLGNPRDPHQEQLAPTLREARLRQTRRLVSEHLSDTQLSVGSVARALGVSPRYVQKLFENQGTSFSRYVLEQRLASAWRLLTQPAYRHWPVTRIALETGFGNISYFNRCFRRAHGATPSEVRRQAQNSQSN